MSHLRPDNVRCPYCKALSRVDMSHQPCGIEEGFTRVWREGQTLNFQRTWVEGRSIHLTLTTISYEA